MDRYRACLKHWKIWVAGIIFAILVGIFSPLLGTVIAIATGFVIAEKESRGK